MRRGRGRNRARATDTEGTTMTEQADDHNPGTRKVFYALIDNFPDMIHSVDAQGNLVYVNRAATLLLGYTEDELRGMNIRSLYPPEILAAVEKGFREVKQSGAKQVESLFVAKDGTRIPVELRTLVLRGEEGSFTKTFTVSRDLRRIKEMQENLIHTGRLAAIGELAAGVVHDLNNPLTAVILATTILKRLADRPETTPDQLREETLSLCETIAESAATMENLTTRLRDFSRGVKEQHAPVDLFDPINDALFILAHKLRYGNIKVSCPVPLAHHIVRGDRNQIQQVFLNLFANACDAMAQRPTRELTVWIDPEDRDGAAFWRCAVQDSGEGIPPEIQEKVFASFFTTKPRGKGTGLGLSITRSILAEHNGTIALQSQPGQGTTFFVSFPATPA
jgi:PAS domain S-box-containing protein